MSQQINLYQPIFRKQKKVFSAITIVQIAGVFALGLVVIYGVARWQVVTLERQVAELEQRRDTAIIQLQSVSATAAPGGRARVLEDQLRTARTDRARMQAMIEALESRRLGDSSGFSARMTGLARQRVNGLWLTRVVLREGGLELEGRTEAAELLPRYVTRLGREPAFQGTQFAQYRLQRGETPGAPIAFTMSTAGAEEGS